MLKSNEGVRRLSLLVGSIAAFLWLPFCYLLTGSNPDDFSRLADWLFVLGGSAACFVLTWAFVRGVGWVICGFMEKR
jgi:flagellar motor component MotA